MLGKLLEAGHGVVYEPIGLTPDGEYVCYVYSKSDGVRYNQLEMDKEYIEGLEEYKGSICYSHYTPDKMIPLKDR